MRNSQDIYMKTMDSILQTYSEIPYSAKWDKELTEIRRLTTSVRKATSDAEASNSLLRLHYIVDDLMRSIRYNKS